MKSLTATWDLPVTREDGKALPKTEIDNTEVLLGDANGANFASLAKVKPDATQTVNRPALADGTYTLRFVVTDTFGNHSKPFDLKATVQSAAPGIVANVQIAVT